LNTFKEGILPISNIPPEQQTDTLWAMAAMFAVAFFAQFSRLMSGENKLPARRIFWASVIAGVAGVITGGLVITWFTISWPFALALGGIAGYIGGNAITALAMTVEERMGIKLNPALTHETPPPPSEITAEAVSSESTPEANP
jgi:hypothetical protein